MAFRARSQLGRQAAAAAVALCAAAGGAQEPLFSAAEAVPSSAPEVATSALPIGPPSLRQRRVALDTRRLAPQEPDAPNGVALQAAKPLRLNLFRDASFDAIVERTFPLAAGHALRGTLAGVPGGRFALAVRGDTVTGTVLTRQAAYVIRPAGGGHHAISQVHRAWFPLDEGQPRRPPPPAVAPARMFEQREERAARPAGEATARLWRKSAPAPIARGHRESGVAGFGGRWAAQGPGPILFGQVESVTPDNEVVGAAHTVLAHPTDPDIIYIGATNGGIWRTDDATSLRPTWRPLTDHASSLSIGAMAFDAEDGDTIVAGIGRYSSYGRSGGDRTGLLRSRDAGETWREIRHPVFGVFHNVSGLAARGDRIVATTVESGLQGGGVFRTTDGGATWAAVEGIPGTAAAFDLVVDPRDADRMYATIGRQGVFRSDDGGATWRNASSHDSLLTSAFTSRVTRSGRFGDNNNAELAVGADGRVYVAVLIGGQANYIGFTDDQGGVWTAMDLPLTRELNDAVDGLNPRFKPGAQGSIHFSILVDPDDSDTVYVGGDRQDLHFFELEDGGFGVASSIGARDYSGRLFRGDAGIAPTGEAPSPQWEHLTHRADVADVPGGGTAHSSSPHADSREMVFDANGDIVEVDDGGVYRRTSPRDNTGDWFSLNGNLQISEMHDIAYDPVSKRLIGGNQDTGTPYQRQRGPTWHTLATADGGDVAVDASEAPDTSHRYSSTQFLFNFLRTTYDASGALVAWRYPALQLNGEFVYELDPNFDFTQRISLNAVDPTRGVIGAASVYETFDRFETLTEAASLARGALQHATATAYGCVGNTDLLYFGLNSSYSPQAQIMVRRGLGDDGEPSADDWTATTYVGGLVRDIVIDPADCDTVYALDALRVQASNDGGETWRDVTGNLADAPVSYLDLHKIEVVPAGGFFGVDDAIVVGGRAGAHVMFPRVEGLWFSMNEGLPHAPVWDLDYSPEDNALFAATLGRGAWRLDAGPQVAARIADQTLEVAGGAIAVDLAGVFAGVDTEDLTYSVESGNAAIATASIDGEQVMVTPNAAGEVILRVTATNAAGLSAVTTFTVTIGAVLELPATTAVREGDLLLLPVRLSRPLRSTAVLRYALSADANVNTPNASPQDYFATGYLVLSGGARSGVIVVQINDDGAIEPTRELFQVTLSAPAPNAEYGLGLRHSTTVTIKEGVCDRSLAVRDAIRAGRDCAEVANVAGITSLDLRGLGISFLRPEDFSGMSGLRELNLSANALRSLPPGIFGRLVNMRVLALADNQLTALPRGVFFEMPNLHALVLSRNRLTTLAPTVLLGSSGLRYLYLDNNQLEELSPWLLLEQSVLLDLDLHGNRINALPDGFFRGLAFVGRLNLAGNPGAPFTFSLDLQRADADANAAGPADVVLGVRQGAPFDIAANVTVAHGMVNSTSEEMTAIIRTGQVVGERFTVAQVEDQAATVSIVEAPPVPPGTCDREACYEGVAIAAGEPLVLFKTAP